MTVIPLIFEKLIILAKNFLFSLYALAINPDKYESLDAPDMKFAD